VALRLYDRLNELPAPRFAKSRMKLPCIAFKLPSFSPYQIRSGHVQVYRAETLAFGIVEIETSHDLSQMNSVYLVHPWLDTLLEREGVLGGVFFEDNIVPPSSPNTHDEESFDDGSLALPEPESSSLPAPVRMVPMDRETRARRLVAHLRQPFGALLVELALTGRAVDSYRRVAADSMITVQFQEKVSLADLLDNVRIIDVL
jgi:hypothetical protein